jgi:hypothetical protein
MHDAESVVEVQLSVVPVDPELQRSMRRSLNAVLLNKIGSVQGLGTEI